jgi:chorismate-pyruvate lyase
MQSHSWQREREVVGKLHIESCHEPMRSQQAQLLDPLDQFYLESGLPLPSALEVEGSGIPEPYRRLLVHQHDMTPTLEAAYQQRIHLRLLKRKVSGDVLLRQVVLVLDSDEKPVEFGAIRIQLKHLPAEARRLILEGKLPLGRVLQDFGVEHSSRPVAYFQVVADPQIREALHLTGAQRLYGRRNRLLMQSNEVLAEVVEILPPSTELSS